MSILLSVESTLRADLEEEVLAASPRLWCVETASTIAYVLEFSETRSSISLKSSHRRDARITFERFPLPGGATSNSLHNL
jgi:hypothetical protein